MNLTIARNQKYNLNKDDNTIYLLLDELVNRCKELKEKDRQDEKTTESSKKPPVIEPKSFPKSGTSSLADIIKFLMNGDLDNSFKALSTYLASINKSDYEFLIVDLIKISFQEKDIAFIKPMTALTLMSRENYCLDISTYIQEFYMNLSQNKFEEARIYLDIISKGNKLVEDCFMTDSLYQILEASEGMSDYKKNSAASNKIDDALEKSKENPPADIQSQGSYSESQKQSIEEVVPTPTEAQVPVQPKLIPKKEITQEQRDSEKQFMDKKYEELLNKKGIILLRPMDYDRIDRIFEMVENYPDMVAFVIGEENKQQVVLRYKPTSYVDVDVKNLIKLGNQAYQEGNYNGCIKNFLQLLQIFKNPRSIIYSKLGLAYMQQQRIPLAIDYLTIANDLAKKENPDYDYDYSDLIARLKGDIPRGEKKPNFRMTEKDFDYSDVGDYYGVDNFAEINSFIIESGLDVESACEQLGLPLEEVDIIKLIYARGFYTQGDYGKGDVFLKSVEKSKNKTPNTKKIFEEVRKNKRFYQNRKSDSDTRFVLTISPKKK